MGGFGSKQAQQQLHKSLEEQQHSPLSASKTMLATTKSLTSASSPSVPFTSPTPTMASTCSSQPQYAERTSLTAAGAINTTEAATSAFNKYHNAPEMQAIDCHRHNKQTTDIRDLHNDGGTGSKKSLNRFASLAEFDETKIPNLPADTNIEDIEGQLKIIYDVREISKDGKLQPNLLLSNETDEAVSSDNELFTDCNEELSSGQRRDCLSSPFKEHNVNKTNDLESYYSTVNDTISASDHTLDEFSEIPMDDGQKQQYTEMNESVEPMEVDMNTTIEMMEATSSTNILFVERVLEQAERHILQHLEEEESLRAKEELALAAKTHKQSEVALPLERNSMQTGEYTVQQRLPTTLSVIKPELVGESSVTTKGVEKQEEKLLSNSTISSPKQLNITTSQYPKVSEENKTLVEHIDLNSTLVEQDLPSLHNLNFDLLKGHPEQKITFGIASTEAAANPIDNLQQTPLNSTSSSNNLNFGLSKGHPEEKITFAPIENAVNKINNVSVPSNTIFVEQNLPSLNNLNPTFPSGNDEKRTNFNLGLIESAANAVNNQPLTLHIGSVEQNLPSFNNLNPSLPSGQAEKRRTFVIPSIENSAEVDTQEKLITDNEKQNTFSIEERMSALNTHLTVNNIETEEKGTFIEALVEEDVTKNVVMIDNEKRRRTFTAQKEIAGENRDVDVRNTEMEHNLPSVSAEAAEAVECAAVDNLRAFSTQSMENKTEKDNEIVIKENRNLKDMISEKSEAEELQKNNKTVSKEMISNYEAMDVDETALLPQNSSLKSSNNPEKSIHSPPVSTIKPTDQLIGQSKPALEKENLKVSKSLMSANETKNNNEIHEENLKADTVASSSHETLTSQLIEDKHGTSMPVPKGIQKRPSIHDYKNQTEVLSAKEQSNIRVRDEKELMSEKSNSASEEIFTATSSATLSISGHSGFDTNSPNAHSSQNNSKETEQQFPEEEFQSSNNIIWNPCDFDFLLTKGNNNAPIDRSSLLLKFDPLLGKPLPVNNQIPGQGLQLQSQQEEQQQQQQHQHQQLLGLQLLTANNNNKNNKSSLSPTLEENSTEECGSDVNEATTKSVTQESNRLTRGRSTQQPRQQKQQQQRYKPDKHQSLGKEHKKHATMSVDVDVIKDVSLDNDCNKTYDNSNNTSPTDDKPQINYKMDELEKKIKNEVLKTEDIEKKLKDAEQREEALIKRITEKDKTLSKMNGVMEAYEKAIAELIAEKEQLIQNYEKQLVELKTDRDSNYHHLTSLETTFSDLHVKYEKSKEMTCQLKANEEALLAEKRHNLENLRLQEQRYEKMKNHAMQQLEIANKKLESFVKDHAIETTKLKASLKKEEIARSSITEQLMQKTKENAELMKICDELISGQGS